MADEEVCAIDEAAVMNAADRSSHRHRRKRHKGTGRRQNAFCPSPAAPLAPVH
jgi:hypothetical protein